ncbi:MAG TPA: cytochrome c biogenesis protein CcsA [Cryomorphaceae bacterium]|nr:cytochrome c biogenesis protein CcsA [Cryomorphaceae bacterium]
MIEYLGEHTLIGRLGEVFVSTSFAAAFLAAISYFVASRTGNGAYRRLGRAAFWLHSAALIATAATLFIMLFNKYFEYDYVWKHANRDMPLRYIFSGFWEGQEGSFILWSFWNVVLGNILLLTAKKFENLTMAMVSVFQMLIGSMLLGVYVFDFKLGNSPFDLIRALPENVGLPWTQMPNYLERIPSFSDGRGMNPLLQNYWMTIHPPTLFLGYASTLFPFAFAIAGLASGKLKEWIRPAIPWAFFSVSVLGIGILMGGAWAYEALSFGGFWAWDPVENASLIPWLTLVGAAHVMVVNQRKNRSQYTALFLTLITTILVMYASFLVHSGVLGDTSVHSFTDDGLMKQHLFILLFLIALPASLMLFETRLRLVYWGGVLVLIIAGWAFDLRVAAIVAFLVMSVVMPILAYKKFFVKPEKEEALWSREFWIFIGSMVLLLSAAQIALETSKPIWNILAEPFAGPLMDIYAVTNIEGLKSLAEGKLAPNSDRINHFNKWQIPFAFVVTFLIAFTQFLRYGKTNFKQFAKRIMGSLLVTLVITLAAATQLDYEGDEFILLILFFTTVFAVLANFDYATRILKGKFDASGASVAHIGFGLILLGALISTSRSEKISENASRFDIEQLSNDFKNNEDVLLFKQDTIMMGGYFVSYKERNKEGVNVYYKVEYFDAKPIAYKEGDHVIARGVVMRAKNDHVPGSDFILDQGDHWEVVQDPRGMMLDSIPRWTQYRPGEKLFDLNPRIQLNPEFGNVAEPSTKRYWDRDIYTHIRWAELEVDTDATGFRAATEVQLGIGDTALVGSNSVRLNQLSVVKDEEREKYRIAPNDLAVKARIGIKTPKGEVYEVEPLYILRDSILPVPDPVIQDESGVRVNFDKIDPATGKHTFLVAERFSNRKEFIVMQAIQFPMINILWIGCIIMFLGTVMAIRHRIKLSKRSKTAA